MTRAGTIPLSQIERIEIYQNKKRYKESQLSTILKETGGDLIFNGTIFSWTAYKPLCHCKAAGAVLCNPNYSVYGMTLGDGGGVCEAVLPCSAQSYIACVPLIVKGGKIPKPNYQKDMGGSRPRTAIGMKDGRFAYFTTSSGYTPEKLRDYLFSVGWSHATMLDGGGSTCFRDKDGGFCCDKNRKVQNYIVAHLKHSDNEPEGEKPMVEINAYSKANDGAKKLSTNFAVKEFACNDGSDAIMVAPRLVMVLQTIRSHFAKAVTVHSAYRTPQYNEKVGGVAHSQHCYGTAADISIKGVTPAQIASFAREIMPDWGGVGIYSTFCHVDVRELKSDWNG